jgi:arylsulfatase A-like enzyme
MRFAAPMALLAAAMAPATALTPSTSQPNVVMLLVDDWGWSNVGFHHHIDASSSEEEKQAALEAHTPNIDKLVAEGIELDRH